MPDPPYPADMADRIKKAIRSILTGESEEQAARLKAGPEIHERRLAELGFTEHRWGTGPFAYTVCETCRAWLSTNDDDLRVHRAFHDRLSLAGDS